MGKDNKDSVSLKEYMLSQIDVVRKELMGIKELLVAKDAAIEAETKVRHDGLDTALKVAKQELEGRLFNLNDLRKEVVEDRIRLIGKDTYFAHIDAERKSTEDILKRVTILETRSVTWSAAIMLFFIIVEVLMRIFKL
jgi:hypothetical protein